MTEQEAVAIAGTPTRNLVPNDINCKDGGIRVLAYDDTVRFGSREVRRGVVTLCIGLRNIVTDKHSFGFSANFQPG